MIGTKSVLSPQKQKHFSLEFQVQVLVFLANTILPDRGTGGGNIVGIMITYTKCHVVMPDLMLTFKQSTWNLSSGE